MRALTILGWLLAVAAVGAAAYLYLDMQALREEIAAAGPASPTPEPNPSLDELTQLKETVAMLEAELAEYRKNAEAATEVAPVEAAEAAAPPPVDPAALLQGMLARTEGSEEPGKHTMMESVSKMFEGEQGERMLTNVVKSQMTMMYGDFLKNLGLDEAGKDAVREILARHLTEAARTGMDAMGSGDMDSVQGKQKELEAAMRAELEEVLTPAEMESFDAYQSTLGARMLSQGLEMQMQFMAPDISAENRALIADIAYEEAMATPELASGNAGANPAEAFDQQIALFDRLLERASQTMDAEQYAATETFLRQQQEMMQSYAGIFGGEASAE